MAPRVEELMSLANGQCAHRWPGLGRCLELAITTRPVERGDVVYDVPLCRDHAGFFDAAKTREVAR